MRHKDRIILEDEDGLEVEIPSRFDVCDRCRGKGVHDHPAFSNGITADEWNGPDWDDDSRETYMSGGYDVTCEECGGLRVVLVADEERMTDEQRRLWEQHCEWEYQDRMERRNQERFGY